MLDRYKKTGGFNQLLTLLETCGPQKQQKFLEIIRTEDSVWADAIKVKMLDIHRIFGWSQEAVAEVCGSLQDLTLAVAMHGLSAEENDKIRKTFSHARIRKIDDLLQINKPTPAEISTMYERILVEVRRMITDGHLRMEKIDPELDVPDDFEAMLDKGEWRSGNASPAPAAETETATVLNFDMANSLGQSSETPAGMSDAGKAELGTLRKRVQELGKENATLRHDVQVLKTKLDQIKKMVA